MFLPGQQDHPSEEPWNRFAVIVYDFSAELGYLEWRDEDQSRDILEPHVPGWVLTPSKAVGTTMARF
jgi:hypothetical protein